MKEKHTLLRQRRALALLLTLCLLLTCMPLPALSVNETAESAAGEAENTSDEVYIIEEDVTKRGEFEKHFLCSDGTYRAVTYAEPVHHYDFAAGAWQDNDVSLALNAASARYEAQSGSFAVSFAKSYAAPALDIAASDASGSLTADGGISQNTASDKTAENGLYTNSELTKSGSAMGAVSAETSALPSAQTVTMTNGTYPISWTTAVKPSLSVTEGSTAIQRSAALDAPKLLTRTPAASILTSAEAEAAAQQSFAGKPISDAGAFAAANRVSVAEYASVAQVPGQGAGVSLRYSVSQHKIKEDIIIASRSAATDFVTTLDVGALTAAAQDDGSVLLVDEYGNTAYTVGVPYLYDADYNVSYDVAVTVEQTGSVCRITYAPNREWLDDTNRAYPVVLDPTVTSSEYYANIVDTYVTQADSNNHSAEGNLVVGIKSGKLNRAYIRINNLPSLPDEVLPLSANLTIKHGANTTSGRAMSLYRTNSSWSPTTITYSNQPSSVTSVASCAFNTANVSFDIPKTHIDDLYNREAAGVNYGYMIRYSSESTTNPDYNMLRSMEYPTASEQPLFTVNYGYSLPVGLVEGTVYSFKNVGSSLYLDVCGGTDADNNNVAQYKGNSTVSQDFKLEQSSTGNGYILRAQVGGKTRVLDIYKTNGRVENGNNVQIYRNTDPIAQEWLIIPVSRFHYKIVPRSNPALALTSYGSSNGSASGTTSTSAGNVFVSTYTGNNPNQYWIIEKQDGTGVQPGITLLEDGEYYLNNSLTSLYMKNNAGNVTASTMPTVSSSCRWKFTNMGGKYLIQPANNLNLYLAAPEYATFTNVSLITLSDDIPDRCLWTVTKSLTTSTQLTITSNIGRRLTNSYNGNVQVVNSSTTDVWRYTKTVNAFSSNFTINNDDLYIEQTKTLSTNQSGKSFTGAGDFTYTVKSGTDIISLTTAGKVTAKKVGTAKITVLHKPSGYSNDFSITVRKDAIIVLPGIMGSTFVAKQNFTFQDDNILRTFEAGDVLWPPALGDLTVMQIDAMILSLRQNNSGMPLYSQVGVREPKVNTIVSGDNQYGAQNTYKNLYYMLYAVYNNNFDIILYEYDWRKDPYDTANELDAYINNNCGRVIFVSHSMGGLVSSYYLAKGSAQRARVIKHISLGTPYLGAEKMPYVMMTGQPLGSIEDFAIFDSIKDIIWNLKSTYALIPMQQNFQPYLNYGYINGNFYNTLGTYNSYASTMSDMSEKLPNWNNTLYNSVKAHQANLFTSNGKHITSLVDSYYIIGDGETTAQMTTLYYHYTDDSTFCDAALANKTKDGDGTVTIHSATINGTINENQTFYTYGREHQNLGGGDGSGNNIEKEKMYFNFIAAIINDEIELYSDSLLASYFNMYRTRQD